MNALATFPARASIACPSEPEPGAGTDAGAPIPLPVAAPRQSAADRECGALTSRRYIEIPAPGGLDPISHAEPVDLNQSPTCYSGKGGESQCPAPGAERQPRTTNHEQPTTSQLRTAHERHRIARAYDELKAWHDAQGLPLSLSSAAGQLRAPLTSLWKILKLWLPNRDFDALIPPAPRGRKAQYELRTDELDAIREILVRLDKSKVRGRGLGSSKYAAFRLAAQSEDPRISPEFRELILNRRSRSLPPSITRALDTPASVLARARDKRSTMTSYISTPRGRTWIDESGQQRVTAPGDCLSADDGTLNFYAWIPWPFGGDKCSDKFGVKLGRWQLLVVIDDRSEMCVAFDIVARQSSAYGAADVAALMGRAMIEILKPEWWLLERGSWESDHVKRCLDLSAARVKRAWESKQKSAVERFFDRAWTPLSLVPGHSGRDRGRFKQVTDLALACQEGRRDPRDFFLSLTEAAPRVGKAVEYCNTDLIESHSGWGKWIPQERFTAALAERPREKLPPTLSLFFAREQRSKTVRGGGVGFSVECPEVRFPVFFQCPELWEFEGCEVKCYFDPYADPVLGTITLHDREWRGFKRGHIIARDVPALGGGGAASLPPQAVFCDDWTSEAAERSLAVRKAISKAVRTETWNYLGARTSQARDGFGNTARAELGAEEKRSRGEKEQGAESPLPLCPSAPLPQRRSFPAATPLDDCRRAALRAQAELAHRFND